MLDDDEDEAATFQARNVLEETKTAKGLPSIAATLNNQQGVKGMHLSTSLQRDLETIIKSNEQAYLEKEKIRNGMEKTYAGMRE